MKYVFCMLVLIKTSASVIKTGQFWHISDHRWDPYYNPDATTPIDIRPSSYGRKITEAGPLGNYKDDSLHTNDQSKYLGKEKVLQIIGNITRLIKETFPNTTIFPALGNHDYHPKSQIPPGGSDILTAIADIWKPWLSENAYDTFKREGFYKEFMPYSRKHIIVILNSNVWYSSNKQVNGSGDPGGEFQWMRKTLKEAENKSRKVYIAGHVPPGYFEMVSTKTKRWFYQRYNEEFIKIVRKYKHVISGMFFGHHHSDTFKVFKDTKGEIVQSMLLTPGVTPWVTTLGGVVNGSNNPGIRLIKYDRDSMQLKDFVQYYLDLTVANRDSENHTFKLWREEYTATTAYGIDDVTTLSMGKLATAMRRGCESNSSSCPKSFIKYRKFNSVSYNLEECSKICQKFQLCAITEVDIIGYESCMENWGNRARKSVLSICLGIWMPTIWLFVCAL